MNNFDYKNLTPFKWFVLENFPFIEEDFDALTNWQLFCKLGKEINKIINSENILGEQVENITNGFITLENYVNNYFNNLDVQEEINNKLDSLAQDGTLTQLIGAYIQPLIDLQNQEINRRLGQQDDKIRTLESATPLVASSVSEMTDTSKIYVNTTDGYWYYYNGTNWVQGGVYQAPIENSLINTYLNLKNSIENNQVSINKYNKNSLYNIEGKYYNAGGSLSDDQFSTISHPIYVEENKEYKFPFSSAISTSLRKYVSYIKPDGTLEAGTIGTEDGNYLKFIAPKSGFIVLNVAKSRINEIMFCLSSEYPNSYIPYSIYNSDLKVDYSNIIDFPLSDLTELLLLQRNENLFDKNSLLNRLGLYDGGVLNTQHTYINVTHPIFCIKGDILRFASSQTDFGSNKQIAKLDVNTLDILAVYRYIRENDIGIFEVPETGYYSISYIKSKANNLMVVKNREYPSEYIEYKANIYNINIPKYDVINPLNNKKLGILGDSIAYGAGSVGGYGKIIGENNNMQVQNIAVSGATITSGTITSAGANRYWINEHVTDLDIDNDYILLEGGVNDASLNTPLGAITEGYDDILDESTYYGAFENMLKQLITRFAGKKYAYIAVHQMTSKYRVVNEKTNSYYWASKLCCEKWGVPFIDLNDKVPAFGLFTRAMTTLFPLREAYTYNADGWHPNEEGYKKYYVPIIESYLKTL